MNEDWKAGEPTLDPFTMRTEVAKCERGFWAWWVFRVETGSLLDSGCVAGTRHDAIKTASSAVNDIRDFQIGEAWKGISGSEVYSHFSHRN